MNREVHVRLRERLRGKFPRSTRLFNFEPKNEPQYIVPALFFPGEINQLNIAPFYW